MTPINSLKPELENEVEISVKPVDQKPLVLIRTRKLRKFGSGMFGVPEIVAVSVAGVFLTGVIFAYFFVLLPAREEFKKREAERSQKQTQLTNLEAKALTAGNKAAGTVDLVSSVDRFENNFLPFPAAGNAALYQRLNQLIRSNNVRNTAGPEYSTLETIDATRAAKANDRQTRGNKQQGIFPGTYVTLTVEGSYANLRRFISELENTRQFLVINAIEIESNGEGEADVNTPSANAALPNEMSADPNDFPGAQMLPNKVNPRLNNNPAITDLSSNASNPARRGAVSLRLEMATYFRRPVATAPAAIVSPTN